MNKVKKKTHPKGLELENTKLKNQILKLSRENYNLKKDAEKLKTDRTTAKLKIEFLKELLYESIRSNVSNVDLVWSHLLGRR